MATILWRGQTVIYANAMEFRDNFSQTVYFNELSDGIQLHNVFPISDSLGVEYEGYKFQIVNVGEKPVKVIVYLEDVLDDSYPKLEYHFLRCKVTKNGEDFGEIKNLPDVGFLFSDTVEKENTYEVKFWLDENAGAEAMGKFFQVKLGLK